MYIFIIKTNEICTYISTILSTNRFHKDSCILNRFGPAGINQLGSSSSKAVDKSESFPQHYYVAGEPVLVSCLEIGHGRATKTRKGGPARQRPLHHSRFPNICWCTSSRPARCTARSTRSVRAAAPRARWAVCRPRPWLPGCRGTRRTRRASCAPAFVRRAAATGTRATAVTLATAVTSAPRCRRWASRYRGVVSARPSTGPTFAGRRIGRPLHYGHSERPADDKRYSHETCAAHVQSRRVPKRQNNTRVRNKNVRCADISA